MEEAERLSKLIAAVVFHKYAEELPAAEEYAISQDELLLGDLRCLSAMGSINEAENLLFERLESNPNPQILSVAGIFYRELSQLTDEELDKADFSRTEIMDGIQSVERIAASIK
jgi:hypothetical protein